MQLTIFGASGRTGIPLVEQGLAAGHRITALVRTPAKLAIPHEALQIIQGDVTRAEDVARAISGSTDAVIVALAPASNNDADMLPVAAQHILAAMRAHGTKRVIWMTGAGVPAPEDKPGVPDRIIKLLLTLLSGAVLAKSEAAVNLVRASDRDWTVVRGPRLLDGPATGTIRAGWVGVGTGTQLVRADAAAFMLRQLESNEYLRLAPAISN